MKHISKTIDNDEAKKLIEDGITVIDIRRKVELEKIPPINKDILNIDFYDDFQYEIDELDKDKPYLVYCRIGRRSLVALDIMNDLGFKEVYNLKLGIEGWKR